jgi:hypothetical protein
VKTVLSLVLLAFAGIAHAQVTCQTYGAQTICNGSLGGGIPAPVTGPNPAFIQSLQLPSQIALQNAQAALAAQQAALARAQAEQIRQQAQPEAQSEPAGAATQRNMQANDAIQRSLTPSWVGQASATQLKANADTVEAIMRSVPSDSEAFGYATRALQALNEEMERRAAAPPLTREQTMGSCGALETPEARRACMEKP